MESPLLVEECERGIEILDLTTLHDDDAVVSDNGPNTMGNDEELGDGKESAVARRRRRREPSHRLVRELCANDRLNARIGLCIHRSRSLV